jgi:hypothetical protein
LKNKPWLVVLSIIVFALCAVCFVVGGIWYVRIQNRPPSSLNNDSGYYVRGSKVYFLGGFPSTAFEIENADAGTFRVIDSQYALDDARVYFDGATIPDSDPSTFEVLEQHFSHDARHVYLSGQIFTNDPVSFEILAEDLSRDREHIYWSEYTISDDPAHLEIIFSQDHYTYIKDSKTVYVNGGPIAEADVNTFKVLSPGYARDASQVYYFDQAMAADPNTFEILEIPYSRDSQNVFWMENQIPNADPQTFRILNANFECSADSQTAFYQAQPIPNFDPNTIPTDSQVTNCDINGMYFSP